MSSRALGRGPSRRLSDHVRDRVRDRHRGSRTRLDTETASRFDRVPQLRSSRDVSVAPTSSRPIRARARRRRRLGRVTVAIASGARDDETIRAGIERWIRAHEPDCADAVVEPLTRPAVGLSSDTSFVTAVDAVRVPPARRCCGSRPRARGCSRATTSACRSTGRRRCAPSGIPTAPARYEPDPAWLGAPFMVMPRVAGRGPGHEPVVPAGRLAGRRRRRAAAARDRPRSSRRSARCTGCRRTAVGADAASRSRRRVDRWCAYLDWAATGGRGARLPRPRA